MPHNRLQVRGCFFFFIFLFSSLPFFNFLFITFFAYFLIIFFRYFFNFFSLLVLPLFLPVHIHYHDHNDVNKISSFLIICLSVNALHCTIRKANHFLHYIQMSSFSHYIPRYCLFLRCHYIYTALYCTALYCTFLPSDIISLTQYSDVIFLTL